MKLLLFTACFLWMQAAVSQQGHKLPPNSKLLFFGDSHTLFGYSENGNSVQYQNKGYVAWVNAFCPHVQIPKGGILAALGETTPMMLSRMQPIQSFGARILVVLAGGNDALYGISTATTMANLRQIYNKGLAAGMRVIALAILPRYDNSPFRDLIESARRDINAWIKAQTDITAVDNEAELKNAALYEDGIHLNPTGCMLLAKKIAEPINEWVTPCLAGSADAAQLGFAGNGNPLLTGTSGSKNNATGQVADKWNLNAAFAGTASVSGIKETDGDGVERQVITISGSYFGSSKRVSFNNYTDGTIALKAGDVVHGVANLVIPEPLVGIKTMYLRVFAYNEDHSVTMVDGNSLFSTSPLPVNMPAGTYALRTPPFAVGAGTAAHLTLQVIVEFEHSPTVRPVSATFRFSSIGLQRLPVNEGPVASISSSATPSVCSGQPVVLKANSNAGYTYQWLVNNTNVAGQTAAMLTVTQPGSYAVKVSLPGCAALSNLIAVAAGDCPSQSAPNRWTGAAGTAWENRANWSLNVVPDENMDVVIDSSVPVVLSKQAVVRSLKVEKGSSLKMEKNASLKVLK